jgi:primosomal protein N' (replication factor Y)
MAERRATTAQGIGSQNCDGRAISVLVPLPLTGPYSYLAPSELALAPGDVVRVPLGRREVVGVVWDGASETPDVAPEKLKTVLARCPVPPLPEVSRRFVAWVAGYTLAPLGTVLRMALSVPSALDPPRPRRAVRPGAAIPESLRLTPARRKVLAVAEDGFARPMSELARAAGVGSGVVKGLIEAGALEWVELPPGKPFAIPDWQRQGPSLSEAQEAAAGALRDKAAGEGFSVTLLDGVTGSGKTEVYFEAVAAALAAGRQVLVLLPEIALSAQWLARFEARFGVLPAVWHSEVGSTRRRQTWRAVAAGEARVVVGARSALFLPYPELGLIVVDEEHEAAFKQEDGVIYHARDMAVVRAQLGAIPIVLASATPSLESVLNVEAGKYGALHLPDRHGGAEMPRIELVDLRIERPPRRADGSPGWLSPPLRQAVAEALAKGEQALLFLNRRGYAPLTLCRACGHRLQCPNCTAWLVEHRLIRRLQCHHCGHAIALPRTCPSCEAEDSLAACGPGVERLGEEVAELFPEAETLVMSSDTLPGPSAAAEMIERIRAREVDLVIGTQIVAKGHHFPLLTCVGVIDADLGLGGGDLRAVERSYHLLHQVAGRAGRGERPGRALLQTVDPDHPVMQALASGARDDFLAREAEARRAGHLPPFWRLAAIILSDRDPERLDATAAALARRAPHRPGLTVLGPAPAPLAVLRGRHRRRFLVKAARELPLQSLLRDWLAQVPLKGSLRLTVDIDPYSFL